MDAPFASLMMYPFASLRPAWEQLWAAVHERAPWTPAELRWSGTVYEHAADARCALAHACGGPVATVLRQAVNVVGAFTLDHPGTDGHRYRSKLISASADDRAEWSGDAIAAVNGDDSLSGWVSLGVAAGGAWPGQVRQTGAHLESVRAVGQGLADVASIDATSWAHIARLFPELTEGVHIVGHGPWVPSPPLVVPVRTPPERISELRDAFSGALADPALGSVRRQLLVDGFVPLDHADYEAIAELAGV